MKITKTCDCRASTFKIILHERKFTNHITTLMKLSVKTLLLALIAIFAMAETEAVHMCDIRRQTMRMWENVEVLLKEADCDYGNVGQMIVYLRDIADFHTVKKMYDERFPETPKVFLLAPVCRPEWLIEMECIAIKATKNNYNKF